MFHISVRFQDTAETLLQRVTAQAPAALRGGESMKNLSEKMLSFLPVRDVRKKVIGMAINPYIIITQE